MGRCGLPEEVEALTRSLLMGWTSLSGELGGWWWKWNFIATSLQGDCARWLGQRSIRGPVPLSLLLAMLTRAEWKILKLEFAKVWGRFWTTSQHWFQNSFRNHDRTIRLVLNQTNVFYRNTQFYNGKMAKISPKINKIEIWPKSRPKVINSRNKSHRGHILGMFEL